MMRSFIRVPFAILSCAVLCSCAVFMTKPFPTRSPAVDQEKLRGTWITGDEASQIEFDEKGVGHMAGLSWNGSHYTTEVIRIYTAAGKVHRYMAVEYTDDSTNSPLYAVYRYSLSPDGNQLFLWNPDMEVFEQAIKDGGLQGVVTHRKSRGSLFSPESPANKSIPASVTISNEPVDILSFMDSSNQIDCFTISEPPVAYRLIPPDKKDAGTKDVED